MALKIHEYPNEAFTINDEDFYDVDWWNGVDFESRKISGLTLKTLLSENIFNSDGTLTDNRIVDLDGFQLTIGDNSGSAIFNGQRLILNGIGIDAGVQLQASDTQEKQILFKSNNLDRWKISCRNFEAGGETGSTFFIECFDDLGNLLSIPLSIFRNTGALTISNAYELPTTDGSVNQVLKTNGSGILSFEDPIVISETIDDTLVSTASLLIYIPHLGFVPDAGTYLVQVNFEARNSLPNQLVYAAIFKDNVNQIERRNFHANANQFQNSSLQKYLTFDGIESVSLRMAMSGGTTTTEGKSIVLTKIV